MSTSRRLTAFLLTTLIVFGQIPMTIAQTTANQLDTLTKGKILHGFRTEALYLDDSDKALGGRFIHNQTGFTLDLLQIQSVPQAYIWVDSFTVSDMGEPHTQEHLLIGKGNKGRNINVAENMSLTESTASTNQTHTNYLYNTAGGAEAFFQIFGEYMDALLHPDYTEEEVRREVRNWGVTENADKSLRLEEKGSVYNEMTSSMNNPDWRLYDSLQRMIYGEAHPQSFNAGGAPDAIRKMTADDIAKYHKANYHLGNMGAVVSVPKEMTVDAVLSRLNSELVKAEPKSENREFMTYEKLAAAKSAAPAEIRMIEFASENAQQSSAMMFAYPATQKMDMTERMLLDNFLGVFAGDANTNLYKKFIDSKTREMDTGAKNVYSYADDAPGAPVWVGLGDVPAANLTQEKAAEIRQKIMEEFARIAAFKDGSPELKELNDRFRNAITDTRRTYAKFINTPPGFGFRSGGNGYGWLITLRALNKEPEFRKSLMMKPIVAKAESLLASGKNFWRDYITKWKLAETKPWAVVGKANPALIKQEADARTARANAETEVLKKKYGVTDAQEAINKYRAEYDATTAELEKLEKGSDAKFIENPPLTLDDQLDYKELTVGKVKLSASTFDNMTGATTGLALRLDSVPENELVYLPSMPGLLRNTGVIKDGKAISYEEMTETLRKEILSLGASFDSFAPSGRYEIVVRGAGNDTAESTRSVEWMKLILQNPNWTKENLPRMRDVVDQQLAGLRRRMQGSEESWVQNPTDAYRNQGNQLHLTVNSFLTQTHSVMRLRWLLMDAGDAANAKATDDYLAKLAAVKGTRDELKSLLAAMNDKTQADKVAAPLKSLYAGMNALPAGAQKIVGEAAKDLTATLGDLPDTSLAADWAYLTNQIRKDLAQSPDKTIAELDGVRKRILNVNSTRMFYIGSTANRTTLGPKFTDLLKGFNTTTVVKAFNGTIRRIEQRVANRGVTGEVLFVGLMAPNMPGGVMMNTAKLTSYKDTDREKVLDYLASRMYSGGGAHSVFSKTIGAGLAYSNGVSSNLNTGLMGYYAERTPELPQTLKFALGEVKRPLDTPLGEYSTALAFSSRASSPYESRGEVMAANMADGITPEVVARFRRAILEARKTPNLSAELYSRKDRVYERIFPGYGMKGKDVVNSNFFVIGPEKQMAAYEAYLKQVEGTDTQLVRLYPRDFWLVAK